MRVRSEWNLWSAYKTELKMIVLTADYYMTCNDMSERLGIQSSEADSL